MAWSKSGNIKGPATSLSPVSPTATSMGYGLNTAGTQLTFSAATASQAGYLSATDYSRLSGTLTSIPTKVASGTTQGYTSAVTTAGAVTLNLGAATASVAGSMSATDFSKLAAATATNTPSTLVLRDASGGIAVGALTATGVSASGTVTGTTGVFDGTNRVYSAGNPPPATDLSGYVSLGTAQTVTGAKTFTAAHVMQSTTAATSTTSTYSPALQFTSQYWNGASTTGTVSLYGTGTGLYVSGGGLTVGTGGVFDGNAQVYSANNKVPVAGLSATGTASAGTYLRGDGTWSPAPAAPVTSVAGRTGAVVLAPADITGTAVITTDSRLSDARTPTDGTVTTAKIVSGGIAESAVTNLVSDLAAKYSATNPPPATDLSGYVALASTQTVTGAKDFTGGLTSAGSAVVVTTDTRLSNARTPTAHASTHASGGSDALTLAESQVTNLVTDLAAKYSSTNLPPVAVYAGTPLSTSGVTTGTTVNSITVPAVAYATVHVVTATHLNLVTVTTDQFDTYIGQSGTGVGNTLPVRTRTSGGVSTSMGLLAKVPANTARTYSIYLQRYAGTGTGGSIADGTVNALQVAVQPGQ